MKDEDKALDLIEHAELIQSHTEEIQRITISMQQTAHKVLFALPETCRESVRDAAREFIIEGAQKASEGILEAAREAAAINEKTKRSLIATGFLIFPFSLLLGAIVCVGTWAYADRILSNLDSKIASEQEQAQAKIAEEEATLAELKSKTWGVEFMSAKGEEKRYLLLPKGMKVDTTQKSKDGRVAIILLN